MNSAELGTAFATRASRGRPRPRHGPAGRMAQELAAELGPLMLPVMLDMRNRAAVTEVTGGLPPEFAEIDVLMNNTGLALGLNPAAGCSIATLSRSPPPGSGRSAGSNRCRQPMSQPSRIGRELCVPAFPSRSAIAAGPRPARKYPPLSGVRI
jgi:hypothetical protein